MTRNISTIAAVCFLFLYSCKNGDVALGDQDGFAALNADSLAQNISVLASDEFEGRKPFSPGEAKTIAYLEPQFKLAGLEPGNGDSYFQEVPMVRITTNAAPRMQVFSPRGNFELRGLDEYVIWTNKTEPTVSVDKTEIVFAGYGVVAPEHNWNDYEGLDVKGKVVMVLVNDPGFHAGDSTLIKGNTMTYYGRWTYKFEEAARQGARGCLIVHNTAAASYPFTVPQNNWNTSRLRLDDRGKNEALCDIIGWVSAPAASKILTVAGFDTTLLATADKRGFRGRPLGVSLSTSMTVTTSYSKSMNVIGKVTGTERPEETIVYTAHWDHLGIGKPDETGDSIYNGALDNASATAGLIELARAYKSIEAKPKRTVVFLSVTAEEQGLWGSAYYAQNPVYPAAKTVANINMDGLNWYGQTKDIIIVGEDYLKEEAAKENRVIAYENHPEAGYYYRSDHFNFARVGIPAIFTNNGTDVIGQDKDYGKKRVEEYNQKNYHRPSDEFDAGTWKLDGAIADLRLLFRLGRRLAYGDEWPVWKKGSEFKALRDSAR
ncbi:MAG TPA: M28 family peptidase [Chitinophagaceae bacterium]|nr:M28 family peptidase [Chitinophagaceae bacterium]